MLVLALATGFERWIGPCSWQGRACAPSCRPRIAPWTQQWTAPLAKGEERSCVPWPGPYPYFVPAELDGTAQRFVITQHSTGQRRYELTEYAGARPISGLHADEGGNIFTMLWFLFHHLSARGGWYCDPGHRGWRGWDLTDGKMRCRGVVREGQLLLNFRHTPHMTVRFFEVLREGLETWMETATINTELCVCCYPSLARDKGEQRDAGFGTKEHMAKVLANINFGKVFGVKGDKIAMRSFNTWPVNMRILLQS